MIGCWGGSNAPPRIDGIRFDAGHRFIATLNQTTDGPTIFVKDAPHQIIQMCGKQASPSQPEPLDKTGWETRCDELVLEGQRVLAFKRAIGKTALDMADLQSGSTLLGAAGFVDPHRSEAVEAVRTGIAVKMITGGHALTANEIADQVGLDTEGGVLHGSEIETMSDEGLLRRVADISVFARAAPDHKLRLVEALQAEGNIVAMTGDGVTDAPALKRADVGVGMGIKGHRDGQGGRRRCSRGAHGL